MSDARRDSRPRQVRFEISAGVGDLETFIRVLEDYAADNGWAVSFKSEAIGFGDHGPIHKQRLGLIQALAA